MAIPTTRSQALSVLRARILSELEVKTNWGRNDLTAMVDKVYREYLTELLEEAERK